MLGTLARRVLGSLTMGSPARSIPWGALEQKLAERRAAVATVSTGAPTPRPRERGDSAPSRPWTLEPPPPESGVRATAPRELSYSVYTIAEIEARAQARARNASSVTPPAPPGWRNVRRSAVDLFHAFWRGWVHVPSPRPRLDAVCRAPLVRLGAELAIVVRRVPWRTVAFVATATWGALVLFFGLVLLAADLTDDLKPARSASDIVTSPITVPLERSEPLPSAAASGPIEIDEPPPPAPRAATAVAPSKPKPAAAPAKRKEAEIFIP